MKNQISFMSSLFDSVTLTAPPSGSLQYGEDLAKWIVKKAEGSEFRFEKPVPAEHGWTEAVAADGERFMLGFDIAESSVGTDYAEWLITIDKPRKWIIFGSKDSPSRGRLCDLIHNILREERQVREVQWN